MNQEKSELLAVESLNRHLDWPKVKRVYLRNHRECAACPRRTNLDVHHKVPIWVNKNLELDESNLMTLCKEHHLFVGHLMSWKSWNPGADVHAALWKKRIEQRPKWRPTL